TSGGQCTEDNQALEEKKPDDYLKKFKTFYAPLCSDQQIGNASNAQKFQDAYNASIGNIVHPIVAAWQGLKDSPLGFIVDALEFLGNWFSGIINGFISSVLDILGLKAYLQGAIAWIFSKTSTFLGIVILKGYESAGTIFNWLLQGGSYSAESTSRRNGAALTTQDSKNASQKAVLGLKQDQHDTTSLYDKVASLNNPDSLAYKGVFAISNMTSNPGSSLVSGL